jgi:hypothetical protein
LYRWPCCHRRGSKKGLEGWLPSCEVFASRKYLAPSPCINFPRRRLAKFNALAGKYKLRGGGRQTLKISLRRCRTRACHPAPETRLDVEFSGWEKRVRRVSSFTVNYFSSQKVLLPVTTSCALNCFGGE